MKIEYNRLLFMKLQCGLFIALISLKNFYFFLKLTNFAPSPFVKNITTRPDLTFNLNTGINCLIG